MTRLAHLGLSLTLACSSSSSFSPEASSAADGAGADLPIGSRFRPLAEKIEAERREVGAPGVAALLIEDGEVVFAHGFGSLHPEREEPVQAATLFRIGSVNKMLTAAALLQFVAAGRVALDDPITAVIPEFNMADPSAAETIQIEHLLTHASGLVDWILLDVPPDQTEDDALSRYLTGEFESIAYLMAPSGRMWNYSNPNYYLAGLAVERLAGMSYRAAMRERLFAPLGMDRTFFLGSEALEDGNVAWGLSTGADGQSEVVEPDGYDNAWARPAGFAFSSVWDLARFVAFLAEGDDAVLPRDQRLAMQAPQIDTETFLDLHGYGYGWLVVDGFFLGDDFFRTRLLEHGGDIPGYAASVYRVPGGRFAFITLANADGAHFDESAAFAIARYAQLPAPSEPPTIDLDPASFSKFAGSYHDEFNVGRVIVQSDAEGLLVSLPDVDAAGIPYEPRLAPLDGKNFLLHIQGVDILSTFLADEDGNSEYLRTRSFVARRVETARAPLRIDSAALLRSLRAERSPSWPSLRHR